MALVTSDELHLWTHQEKVTDDLRNHLDKDGCDTTKTCVQFRDFSSATEDLSAWASSQTSPDLTVLVTAPSMYESGASFAVYEAIPEEMARFEFSPLVEPKATKNEVDQFITSWTS